MSAFNYEQMRAAREVEKQQRKEALWLDLSLEDHRITQIVADYSGSGDSGAVDGVSARDEHNNLVPLTIAFQELVTEFCYDALEDHYAGWENNDGASGQLVIDVASRTARLEHTYYFTESNSEEVEL